MTEGGGRRTAGSGKGGTEDQTPLGASGGNAG